MGTSVCVKCSEQCAQNHGSLSCSLCSVWFHQQCINMEDQKYTYIISSDKDLLWLCQLCTKRPWHFCVCGTSSKEQNSYNSADHSCIKLQIQEDIEQLEEHDTLSSVDNILPDNDLNVRNQNIKANNLHLKEIEDDNIDTVTTECVDDIKEEQVNDFDVSTGTNLASNETEVSVTEPVVNLRTFKRKRKSVTETTSVKQHTCETCGKEYSKLSKYNDHVLTHSDVKPFDCKLCPKRFYSRSGLHKHVNACHEQTRTFECNICDKKFHLSETLSRHRIVHTPKDQREVFSCDNCHTILSTIQSYKKHLKRNCINSGMYKCVKCKLKFKTKMAREAHNCSQSDMVYPCDQCNKIFQNNITRKTHVRDSHSPKIFCDYCGKLMSRGSYQTHVESVHKGNRRFICDICNITFKSNTGLIYHKRLIHTGERRFVCTKCGERFISRASLQDHEITHGDEKIHKCDQCGKCFKRKYTLKKHKVIHSGEKPFRCDNCGKSFMWYTSYQQHWKKNVCRTERNAMPLPIS